MAFDVDKIRAEAPLPEVAEKRIGRLIKSGNEYQACCPFHKEDSPSFSIFKKPHWQFHCFGCGANGDVVDFVMRFDGVRFKEACEILGGERDAPIRDRAAVRSEANESGIDPYLGYTVRRPPAEAPPIQPGKRTPPLLNPKRERDDGTPWFTHYNPSMVFPYLDRKGGLLGYVLRVEIDAGKKITPLILWCEGPDGWAGWMHNRFPEPRPLYGLDQLSKFPDAQVWIVEGEKAADALRRMLGDRAAVVTWQGGGKAVAKAMWKALCGRRVVLWPDADKPGEAAMIGYYRDDKDRNSFIKGVAHYCDEANVEEVKVIAWDKEKPDGWDAADAEKDGWDGERVVAWAKERVSIWRSRTREGDDGGNNSSQPRSGQSSGSREGSRMAGSGAGGSAGAATAKAADGDDRRSGTVIHFKTRAKVDDADPDRWQLGLVYNDEGKLKPRSLQNAMLFIANYEHLKQMFAWNEFERTIYIMRKPPWEDEAAGLPRAITDADVVSLTGFLERMHLTPKVSDTQNALMVAAQQLSFNPVEDYLHSLEWDMKPRLNKWLCYYLGADDTEINAAFGRRWLISGVARALKPGCKCDTMLILEGPQGLRKSSALRALFTWGEKSYFTDDVHDIGTKDAALQLQGVIGVEIAELNQLSRADADTIKAWLSKQVDRFRPPYARAIQEFPRHCVLAGSVNGSGRGYLKDPTGGRRFWPVTCRAIDLEALVADKDQLWAEAVVAFKNKEPWWLTDEEVKSANIIQAERYEEDVWADLIDDFIERKSFVRIYDIMSMLMIPRERQTQQVEKRIAGHLNNRGWFRAKKRITEGEKPKWAFFPPDDDKVAW